MRHVSQELDGLRREEGTPYEKAGECDLSRGCSPCCVLELLPRHQGQTSYCLPSDLLS